MKRALLILFLIPLKLFSQLPAPSLRCIEILPNGDAKLTWIAPSDPGNIFFSYEIFSSISSSGPFTNSGTVGAIATNSFIHSGAAANIQSRYYFMRTTSGSGGATLSSNSDTLRSLFMNIIPGVPDLKLQYNNLHIPKLNSTATTFTIAKEYPAATWGVFATTSAIKYADTISVCSASLNYQVSISDNSGCISTSNIQGGVYNDKKAPNTPEVDSISVLPNGQTVIAWHVPRDEDIIKYIIYQNLGVNIPIDSAAGQLTTSYTFTSTVATQSALALYVAAEDSCKQRGGFDISPTTMFLQTTYDKCGYKTQLNWNAYQGMKSGVLEYRVYYSVNGSSHLRVGTTTGTSFTHYNVAPAQNISYFVRVINNNKNITASSNRSNFFSDQVSAAGFLYMSKATVLSKTSVQVDLYIDTSKSSTGINIYRSGDGGYYNYVGNVSVNNTNPFYSFVDENADTKNNAYYYKAIVTDSCGNSRTGSNVSKTILLKVDDDNTDFFTKHLKWNEYKGFAGGVSGYNIYRIINDVQSSIPVGTGGPSDTLYTDILEDEAPNGAKIDYKVEAVEGIGNPYPFLERSNSNLVPVYIEGDIYVPNAFAPRGKNKVWLPVTHFVDKNEYSVTVINRWGNTVFQTSDDTQGWDGKGAQPDVYVYLIRFKNSRGEYKEVKGSVILIQ